MRNIEVYDTTLRDGAQMRDISFSVNDKLRILEILDNLGVEYVEGGWPGANPKDIDFFVEAKKLNLKNTTLTAFGSTRKANTKVEEDPILAALLRADTEVVCIVAKSSAWQVETTMRANLDENLEMLKESIAYLKKHNRRVFVDAEHFFDGYKNNAEYSQKFIEAAISVGADRMILCDTNGGSLPEYVCKVTTELFEKYGKSIAFGIHAHNDGELAVANSIRAVLAGAVQVQGTINGYGERCGNANLLSIIPNLQIKYSEDKLVCVPEGSLEKLTTVAKSISEIANMNLNQSQPFVGERAFTHKGGLHASAIAKDKTSYEHIDPALVGNKTRVVVSDQSGTSNIIDWFETKDFRFKNDVYLKNAAQAVLAKIKDYENNGYSFENANASFELLVRRALQENFIEGLESIPGYEEVKSLYPNYFELIENNVHIVNGEKTEATVRIRLHADHDEEKHSVSLGNGPANALDQALRKALKDFYPEIEKFGLKDFKVRIIDSHDGTAATTKVLVTTGTNDKSWNTIGVNANIVKASWDAIVDSIVYGLIYYRVKALA